MIRLPACGRPAHQRSHPCATPATRRGRRAPDRRAPACTRTGGSHRASTRVARQSTIETDIAAGCNLTRCRG
eukprot:4324001-Alexandrium_andersonii.AAC.1